MTDRWLTDRCWEEDPVLLSLPPDEDYWTLRLACYDHLMLGSVGRDEVDGPGRGPRPRRRGGRRRPARRPAPHPRPGPEHGGQVGAGARPAGPRTAPLPVGGDARPDGRPGPAGSGAPRLAEGRLPRGRPVHPGRRRPAGPPAPAGDHEYDARRRGEHRRGPAGGARAGLRPDGEPVHDVHPHRRRQARRRRPEPFRGLPEALLAGQRLGLGAGRRRHDAVPHDARPQAGQAHRPAVRVPPSGHHRAGGRPAGPGDPHRHPRDAPDSPRRPRRTRSWTRR